MASVNKMPAKGDKPAIEILDAAPAAPQTQSAPETSAAETEMQRRAAEILRMAMEAQQGAAIATANTSPARPVVTEASMAAAEKAALESVSAQSRVRVKLPLINKNDPLVTVTINGARYDIKRGETVELPAAVIEVLEHADIL